MSGRLILWALAFGTPLAIAAEPVEPAFSPRQQAHWSFHSPVRPPLPSTSNPNWILTPVDAFILARLDRAGLRPSPPAQRAALLRRITFDLIGLPPTLRELDDFVQDTRPDAYVRVVERLLASPHYGERWAQHWLDVVRYAESDGYEADAERPNSWRYRDYVVRAFHEDKPFDRFLTEQLAGDLLAGRAISSPECLVAAGFNRCGPVHQISGNIDRAVLRQERLTEMTNAVGSAFLGLTVACARCHHHKFDPFSQADYYRLQAFFSNAEPKEVDLADSAGRQEYDRRRRDIEARIAPLRRHLRQLEEPYHRRLQQAKKERLEPNYQAALATEAGKRNAEQRRLAAHAEILLKVQWDEVVDALSPADRIRRGQLREQLHALQAQKPPPPPRAWTIQEGSSPRMAHVLKRGDPHKPEAEVHPDFPRIFRASGVASASREPLSRGADATLSSRTRDRLALAQWLTRPDHPFTARVIANRLWQHHFGRGLVATPNDFGLRGAPPSHPQLLDWLACELISHGWSLKHLHRLMVLSAAYQQSSRGSDSRGRSLDPENRMLWRMNRRRLEGEALRDNALAVSGSLNPALGGPMIRVPLEPEIYDLIFTEGEPDGLWPIAPDPRQHVRRSLYLYQKRNVRLPLLEAFDQPDTLNSCPARSISTFAPQALILLNGPFLRRQAEAFAARLLHDVPHSETGRIDRAYRLALARQPRDEERRMAVEFLHRAPEGRAAAWSDFCLALFNRNEFIYID